ncbi:MAG TPA: hypothetical protein VKP60_16030 [Magnetospirillaceae bacterium]|nr:hypothetical protein [Magnetospirillaceae bacterium]
MQHDPDPLRRSLSVREKGLERTMSGSKTTNSTFSASKAAVRPRTEREEPPVRWPSAATSGGAAYVSNPEPKSDAAGPKTAAEG